jgi:hypothetical protein
MTLKADPTQTSIFDLPLVDIQWRHAPRTPTPCGTCEGLLIPGELCLYYNDQLHCRYCTHKICGLWPPDFTPGKHPDTPPDCCIGGAGPNAWALKTNWWEQKGTHGA